MADRRLAFVRAVREEGLSIAEACRSFEISRPTGYKILHRYNAEGVAGLLDRSRTPQHCPQAVNDTVIAEILALKAAHPSWGPKKLKAYHAYQAMRFPDRVNGIDGTGVAEGTGKTGETWPAASTIGEVLKRAGLVRTRSKNLRSHCPVAPLLSRAEAPNQVWCADYKGPFLLGNGQWCYPLTITDLTTRYLLRCQALPDVSGDKAWPYFVGAFREYGLPQVIRTDNGVPFALASLTGLTRLSLRLIKLGILLERIAPGKPQQNGSHERMHRTLKAETTQPPAVDLPAQQRRFDAWRRVFNEERPHEALDQRPPASVFSPSTRVLPARIPELQAWTYPSGMKVCKVRPSGAIRWRGKELFISNLLCGEYVGLDPFEERFHALYVGILPVAILDEKEERFLPHKDAAAQLVRLRATLITLVP